MHAGFLDPFLFPIPIDFHVLRIIFANSVLAAEFEPGDGTANGFYREKVLALTRQLFTGFCHKHGADPVQLCEAFWLLSRTLCQRQPGNRSIIGKRNGRKTPVRPITINWSANQISAYEGACGSCPIEESCRYNIPAANYYIQGRIEIRGERQKPPQLDLFQDLSS
jgi:hypothetical protein